jgi:AAA15 family ATPase/GTPase
MLIKSIQFKNFKRFSDLEIDLDPTNSGQIPKLVLFIGANGSGKSSVFDGFENLNTLFKNDQKKERGNASYFFNSSNLNYFHKANNNTYSIHCSFTDDNFYNFEFDKTENSRIKVETNLIDLPTDAFYGRTAFRYAPRITKNTIGMANNKSLDSDEDRPKTYIETDTQRLNADIDEVFRGFLKEIKERNNAQENFNIKMNSAFANIFGKIKNPLIYLDFDLPGENNQSVKFWFQKGESKIDYDVLSAGEKMTFEILFNLYARKNLYQNSIVFLDEIDLHLNTVLQKNLLKEITENWIPKNSQLWVASHSLGFIEYAREYEKGAIIDFDNLDFDLPQKLQPIKNFNLQIYEVSIPKQSLGKILLDQEIYFCEGKNDEIYNILGFKKTIFIGGKARNKDEVLFELKNTKYKGIIDRDYLTDLEILDLKKEYNNKVFVLDFYAIENYLYHWENLLEIDSNFKIQEYKQEILIAKQKNLVNMEIAASRQKYRSLKDQPSEKLIKETAKIKEILNSDEIEVFYPYFDLKKYLNPKPNFEISQLVQTGWFKNQIQNIIQN